MSIPLLRALPFLLLCTLACLARPLAAAEVEGLYEAVVPVSGQSAGERTRATAEGFRQVLVKVSGQRAVLAMPAIQAELSRAEALLGSFRYETVAARQPGQVVDGGPLRIRLSFDPASVRGILNRASAAVWGANRPPVFLWVVRDGAPARTLHALGSAQADLLLEVAAQRGLPVVMPPPGETAGSDLVAGVVPPRVADIAARAGARVVLAASVSGAAGRWRAAGVLAVDGAGERLEASGGDEAAVIRELVAQAADRLAARYAVVARTDQMRAVRVRVAGLDTLVRHAALQRWFASLPVVKDVVVEQVAGERVDFLLTVAGDVERLLQAMATDGRFAGTTVPVAEGTVQVIDTRVGAASP